MVGGGAYSAGGYDAQVTKYYGVAVCVMYMCDSVETFAEEVEYMWKGERWNLARVFFFLSRYIAMAQIPILFSLYTPGLAGTTCKAVHTVVLLSTYLGELFPLAIMLLCLFALYDSKRKFAPVLFGSFALLISALLGTLIVYIINITVPPPHAHACFTQPSPTGEYFMLINRVLKLSAQFVMFLFAGLRAWNRFREFNTPLMKVIYMGGVYYYAGIAVMAALDIAAQYYAKGDPKRLKVISYIGRFGTPILANRLILGMYKHFHHGSVHAGDGSASLSGLKFDSPPLRPDKRRRGTNNSIESGTMDPWELEEVGLDQRKQDRSATGDGQHGRQSSLFSRN